MSAYNNSNANNAPVPGSVAPGTNPILKYYEEWNERTPAVTKMTVITLTVCYIISFFFDANAWFGNITQYTFLRGEIYRLVTSTFVGNSLLMLIISFIMFVMNGTKFENSLGSLRFLFMMGTLSLLTNLIYNLFTMVAYFIGFKSAIRLWSCMGFWNTVFSLLTVDCIMQPEAPRQLFCFPVNIPSKYFPLVLYVIFSILSSSDGNSSLIAMMLGYAYGMGYLDRLKPSSHFFENLESGGCWYKISRMRGWVLATTMGHDAYIAVNTGSIDREPSSSSNSTGGGTRSTSSGGRLGGGGNVAAKGAGGKRASGIHGFGDLIDDAEAGGRSGGSGGGDTHKPEFHSFSGAGHKLTDSSSSSSATTNATTKKPMSLLDGLYANNLVSTAYTPSGYSSLPSVDDSDSGTAAGGGLSRDELAAKRLAALGLSTNTNTTTNNTTSNTQGNSNNSNTYTPADSAPVYNPLN